MALPNTLTNGTERAALLSMVYELADCLDAVTRFLLVFDGPLDDIDIEELMIDIATDASNGVALMTAVAPLFMALVPRSLYPYPPDSPETLAP